MRKLAHKQGTASFGELNFAEQAKSISAAINNLSNAIDHHTRLAKTNAKDPVETRKKCLRQVHRLLGRLIEKSFVILVFVLLTGCEETKPSPQTEANNFLKTQLDRWVAGESGETTSTRITWRGSEFDRVLLNYEIKSFTRMTDGTEKLLYKDGDWYNATVNLSFQSQAGTEIKSQRRWVVYREAKNSPWKFGYPS